MDKQNILVESIAVGVANKLAGDFSGINQQLAKLLVTSNAINARLEVLESGMAAGTGAKRAVRTAGGPAKATGAKKPPAGKKTGGDASKVTNALLYARYIMAHDIDDAREIYGTEENLLDVEKDALVSKRDKDKDPENYWSAVGAALWKTVLSDEQKEGIRSQYNGWKESSARDEGEPALEADGQ